MKISSLKVLLSIVLLSAVSCHHDADLSIAPPKPAPPGSEFKCSHYTIYFQNSVYPVVLSGCAKSGCHDQATQKGDQVFDNYTNISRLIVPFDPQNSRLYYVLFSNSQGRMPPGTPFTTEQKSIIYWWIKQGGYNNRCDSVGCDSTNVTYTLSIEPILQIWCVSCHSGSKPANGLSLDTYDNARACARGGRLMGAIRHDPGYKFMPNSGGSLSPCEIALFQKWINLDEPQ